MSSDNVSSVVVGKIIGPHGIRGEVKMKSHLVGNMQLEDGVDVILLFPNGNRAYKKLEFIRRVPKGILLTIEGVYDRTSAEGLRNVEVAVESMVLPETSEGEYYWKDLLGLEVFHDKDKRLGFVENVIERSGQDLLEVNVAGRKALIPFVEPIIVSVDIEAGRVLVDLPEGLLELAEE